MATFARSTFSHSHYAAARPSYPAILYDKILSFHRGSRNLAVDLGTGHGVVARALSSRFDRVSGVDPSSGMLEQAHAATPADTYPNVTFRQSSAESLPFCEDDSVDLVTAAQAAHWFDYPRLWPELRRVVRKDGTVAFWGYGGPILVDHARATKSLHQFAYGSAWDQLGAHWQQPGASIVQGKMRDLPVPEDQWVVERHEYEPSKAGNGRHKGEGECWMEGTTSIAGLMAVMRSYSSYFRWMSEHPQYKPRKEGGQGDCVDWCLDKIVQEEGEEWKKEDFRFNIECSTGLILARKR